MPRALILVLLVMAAGCASSGESTPASSVAMPTSVPVSSRPSAPITSATPSAPTSESDAPPSTAIPEGAVIPSGFDSTLAVVTKPDGTTCEVCLWLADTADRRARGLMGVTHLGGPVGMAFRYPDAHTGTFWMKDTLLPLSIVFYAPDGTYLDALDMEPCATSECPNYRTANDFLVAVEVLQGQPDDLGLVPGSALELLSATCA